MGLSSNLAAIDFADSGEVVGFARDQEGHEKIAVVVRFDADVALAAGWRRFIGWADDHVGPASQSFALSGIDNFASDDAIAIRARDFRWNRLSFAATSFRAMAACCVWRWRIC